MEGILILLAVALLVGVILVWTFRRSRAILDLWAQEQGFHIVSADLRWFFKGPYFWRSSKNQAVFRVTVTDRSGQTRTGWVRCGGFWLGVLTDQADVIWEDEQDAAGR